MALPDAEAIGTVLWSSSKDVRGADMGNATLGSPTLAFSLQATRPHPRPRPSPRPSPSPILALALTLALTLAQAQA